MLNCIDKELEGIDLGDRRLNKRAQVVLEGLSQTPSQSLPSIFRFRNELDSAYNFFDNQRVTANKILEPHREATIKRIQSQSVVCLINDTTSLDWTSKHATENLGTLESPNCRGLFLHPTIAITPERVCLGIVQSKTWARNNLVPNRSKKTTERNNTPIEEKESFRWIESYQEACVIAEQAQDTQIIHMGDRESDIMELLIEATAERKTKKSAEILIRSNHDRTLDELELNDTSKTLSSALKKAPVFGEIEFNIPSRGNKKGRRVHQILRAKTITLKKKRIKGKIFPQVKINAVIAIEKNPPKDEKPIIWKFLTTLPINSFEAIHRVIQLYLCRWEIEVFFKVLKSGCKIEEKGLRTAERLEHLLTLYLIVAWKVMFVTMMGRVCSDMKCTEIFEECEWRSVFRILNSRVSLPKKPPSLGEFVSMIAKLGGYLGRKKDPPPGPKVMWIGLTKMRDFARAWEVFVEGKT